MQRLISNICPNCGAEMRRSTNDSPHDLETFEMICQNPMCGASRTINVNDDDSYTYVGNAQSVTLVS